MGELDTCYFIYANIKTSKSTLRFFKPHFCENPSKLANLVDFVTQKKDVIFWNISGGENFEGKKNVRFL